MADSKAKFVVADALISATLKQHAIIMLNDIGYWVDNYESLQSWCAEHSAEVVGMTVNIPDEHTLTVFCLRWA